MNNNSLSIAREEEREKTWLAKINPNVLVSLFVWVVGLIYLFGWHRAEVRGFQDSHIALKIKHEELVKLVNTLEKSQLTQQSYNLNTDKNVGDLSVRVTRLENAIAHITLLNSQLEGLKETQKEMKEDVKKINNIEIQMVEMRNLLEKALQRQ